MTINNSNLSYNNKLLKNGVIIIIVSVLISGGGDGILSIINRIGPFYILGIFLSLLRNSKIQDNNIGYKINKAIKNN